MLSRKSGMLALVLGVAVFGAACNGDADAKTATGMGPTITLTAQDVSPDVATAQTVELSLADLATAADDCARHSEKAMGTVIGESPHTQKKLGNNMATYYSDLNVNDGAAARQCHLDKVTNTMPAIEQANDGAPVNTGARRRYTFGTVRHYQRT